MMRASPVTITFVEHSGPALRFQSEERIVCDVAFTGGLEDEYRNLIKDATWKANLEDLRLFAGLIPHDMTYWENRLKGIDEDIEQFETKVVKVVLRGRDDKHKLQRDIWASNREYREMTARRQEVFDYIPGFGVSISSNELVFYLDREYSANSVELKIGEGGA
jgi:hypothetical protein